MQCVEGIGCCQEKVGVRANGCYLERLEVKLQLRMDEDHQGVVSWRYTVWGKSLDGVDIIPVETL
jgi:hypothetical protein